MIHTTVGFYPNGSWKSNGVPSEDLAEHIAYNIKKDHKHLFIYRVMWRLNYENSN